MTHKVRKLRESEHSFLDVSWNYYVIKNHNIATRGLVTVEVNNFLTDRQKESKIKLIFVDV